MKAKNGMRALSLLLVVALAGAMFVPVVSAEEVSSENRESEPIINIEDLTNPVKSDKLNSEIKIQRTIEKYDLVLFNIPIIREQ